MDLASSSRRAHMVTSLPASARTSENAVPQEPEPSTAMCRVMSVLVRVAGGAHAVGDRVEALSRGLLPAYFLHQGDDLIHDQVGRTVDAFGVVVDADQTHRLADVDVDR